MPAKTATLKQSTILSKSLPEWAWLRDDIHGELAAAAINSAKPKWERCVVANCSSSHKDGVSLFTFTKNPHTRTGKSRQLLRADWHSPSEYSQKTLFSHSH